MAREWIGGSRARRSLYPKACVPLQYKEAGPGSPAMYPRKITKLGKESKFWGKHFIC